MQPQHLGLFLKQSSVPKIGILIPIASGGIWQLLFVLVSILELISSSRKKQRKKEKKKSEVEDESNCIRSTQMDLKRP